MIQHSTHTHLPNTGMMNEELKKIKWNDNKKRDTFITENNKIYTKLIYE